MSIAAVQLQDVKSIHLAHKLNRELIVPNIQYQGITEDATPTEIFINNEPNFRLILPNNGVMLAQWRGVAFNLTDGVGTTHGDVAASVGQFSCKRAETNFVVGPLAITNGTGFTFTLDNTLDAAVLTVTGQANKRILWVLNLEAIFAGQITPPVVANRSFNYAIDRFQ